MKKLKIYIEREKRLFLFYGILNFLITNIILQISLLIIPTILATALSQFVNLIIGFYVYGKKVFKYKKLNNFVFRKYFVLAIILCLLNFGLIDLFFYYGINKNFTAGVILPLLVLISYYSQKNYVFK
tara:strand:- start:4062 stop:4442 length:381 start_codon:yes stop_codon:yes gene_type:complete